MPQALVCTSDSATSFASSCGTPTFSRQARAHAVRRSLDTRIIDPHPGPLPRERENVSFPVRDDALALVAEPADAERHDVAHPQVLRRLHAEAHAGRRAGGDDV